MTASVLLPCRAGRGVWGEFDVTPASGGHASALRGYTVYGDLAVKHLAGIRGMYSMRGTVKVCNDRGRQLSERN